MSNVIRRGLILQEEKDKYNSLGLYYYYDEPGHIAIDHKNPALLAIKRQVAGTLTNNSMALVPYKPLSVKEKMTSLDQITLKGQYKTIWQFQQVYSTVNPATI